jgi:hypothetical protein
MSQPGRHPSDRTLLLGVDHELSVEQKIALDQHLIGCEGCRSRLSEIESTAREISRLHRDRTARQIADVDSLRQRLQANMTDLATTWNRSVWFRIRKGIATLPPARVGASFAFVALVLLVLWRMPASDSVSPSLGAIDADALPNSSITPGAVAAVGLETLCASRPAKALIPPSIRQNVLQRYRMEHVPASEYELDYLITPELGGVGDQRNLWPERYGSRVWNAHVKDDLERLLPRLVCQGTLDLGTAQRDIAGNWIAAYKKYFKTDRPVASQVDVEDGTEDLAIRRSDVTVNGSDERSWSLLPVRVAWLASNDSGPTHSE